MTCKSVTTFVKKKIKGKTKKVKKTVQKCTAKLVTGPVKFTVAGKIVNATLSRAGHVYATGTVWMRRTETEGTLRLRRGLSRGRYALRLSQGRAILSWRTVIAS